MADRAVAPFVVSAPGRVNLIGEHTDHAGGLALPAAVDRRVTVLVHGLADVIRLHSPAFGKAEVASDGSGETDGWARFVGAVAAELAEAGRPAVGIEGTVSSDLPAGAGLASSAALEVAVALALCRATGFELAPVELASLCRRAEHRAVGVPCGVMDHLASVCGRADHVLLMDTSSSTFEAIPLPGEVRLLVLDSGVRRVLADSDYARRRDELQRGIAGASDPRSQRRVRHLRSENERVRMVAAALREDSADLETVGRLMLEGHESLRVDFEVSTPELDALVQAAMAAGAHGARLTGAGFGGCVLAIVPTIDAERIGAETLATYAEHFPHHPARWLVCRAAAGAG